MENKITMTDYLLIEKIQKALSHIKEEAADYISQETLLETAELEAELELAKEKKEITEDIKKAAEKHSKEYSKEFAELDKHAARIDNYRGFISGFEYAQQFVVEKKYTLNDMRKAFEEGAANIDCDGCHIDDEEMIFNSLIESLNKEK